MTYVDPACATCPSTVRACRDGEAAERGPGFCPSKVDPDTLALARSRYDDPATKFFARESALVEATGYGKQTRVQEVVEFAKRMGYQKIGIATCIGLLDLSNVLTGILESHGLEVISVACKTGNIAKEEIGLTDEHKIRPGSFEAACNPIAQAEMLNAHGSQFNVVMGLCLGHDSLFFQHAHAPSTVLVTKDRVLGHNPVAALQLAGSYYAHLYGPLKPATPAKAVPAKRRGRTAQDAGQPA